MSAAAWGITRRGDLTPFNRDPPSCFSSRVARVRRSNSLEDKLLEEKLKNIHLEFSIKKGQIYKEAKILTSQMTGIQRVRETPVVGLERRKLQQAKAVNEVAFHKVGGSGIKAVHERARSDAYLPDKLSPHLTPSTAVAQYPSGDCRCCYTGCRLRKTSNMATEWRTPRSAIFPWYTSANASKENLPILEGTHKYDILKGQYARTLK